MTRTQLIARLIDEGLSMDAAYQLVADMDAMLSFETEVVEIAATVKPVGRGQNVNR